jgi:hypothetical protein
MLPPRIGICLAAASCAFACGDRPELPGPTAPNGDARVGMGASAGMGGSAVTVLEAEPRPAPSEAAAPGPIGAPDGGSPPADGDDGVAQDAPDPVGPGVAVAACTVTETGCVRLFIAVADSSAETCLQLSIDDCNDTTRPGLAVDVPLSWRFASGFVGKLGDECTPKTRFVANDTTIVSGTGSISWNEDTRQPSEIVIDVTLQPAASAGDRTPIDVSSSDLVDPVTECEG